MSSSFAADFYDHFQNLRRETDVLLSPVGDADPNPAEAALKLSQLKAHLARQIEHLPAYDQRSCASQITELETRLAAQRAKTTKPKSRFAFTRPAGAGAGSGLGPNSNASSSTSRASTPTPPLARAGAAPAVSSADAPTTRTQLIADRTGAVIRLPAKSSSSDQSQGQTISLANLSSCIIDLRSTSASASSSSPSRANSAPNTPLSPLPPSHSPLNRLSDEQPPARVTSLHAKSLSRCIVVAHVEGSAILEGLTDCLVVLSSHQFRIHSSHRTAILLHLPSTPIIEHSSALYVGALPAHMVPPGRDDALSRHAEVQDFDWVRAGKSPNWTPLGNTASTLVFTREDSDALASVDADEEAEEIVDRLTGSISGLATAREYPA